jgi:protocatechuate 3,4-dioxygenase beta subunit
LVLTKRVVIRDTVSDADAAEIIQVGGTVYGQDGNPLAGARVRVVERNQAVMTDGQGQYSFSNVPLGDYTLEATAPDGATRRRKVSWGKNLEYDFTF